MLGDLYSCNFFCPSLEGPLLNRGHSSPMHGVMHGAVHALCQSLRFVLVYDLGVGKTIMVGLLFSEFLMRSDVLPSFFNFEVY
jgi:hypothetical protein